MKWSTKPFDSTGSETLLHKIWEANPFPYLQRFQASELLTSTPGFSEADLHFENCFPKDINKIICTYLSIHPSIHHVCMYIWKSYNNFYLKEKEIEFLPHNG